MKILITAFDPFGGCDKNSGYLALELISDSCGNHTIIKETLPVVYNKSIEKLKTLIDKHSPDAVICLGQAGGDTSIRIERIAVNLDDAKGEDNEKNIHTDVAIVEGGPDAYLSTLPTRKMMEACIEKEIPAHLSYTAGNYVCNHVMYGLLNYTEDKDIMGGFIHIPFTPAQAAENKNRPSMSSKTASDGLKAMIEIL